jgi:serine/threonine protein kinase/tetratricopeptide (TPR) repeat protein
MSAPSDDWGERSEGGFRLRAGWSFSRGGRPNSFSSAASRLLGRETPRSDPELDAILGEFAARWRRGEHPRAEEYLERLPPADPSRAVELIYQEYCLAEADGLRPARGDYLKRFPAQEDALNRLLELHAQFTMSQIRDWSAPAPLPKPGDDVGPYRLIRVLGEGAFARVFLATQSTLDDRLVVVKISSRITPEPQLLARAQHSYIVEVLSHGTIEEGELQLIVMPFLGGASLAAVLEHRAGIAVRPRSGRELLDDLDHASAPEYPAAARARPARDVIAGLKYAKAVAWIVARLAEALDFAFDRGVAHGDIKPSNVLLTADGVPMLLDFNLAVGWRAEKSELPSGEQGGTLAYMAPERLQAVAEPDQSVVPSAGERHRADIYALGVVLLEAATGRTPELGKSRRSESTQEVAARYAETRRRTEQVSAWSDHPAVDPALRSILARCLAPDPARRYERAAHLTEDLDRWRTDRPLAFASEPPLGFRAVRFVRRRRRELAAVALCAVVLALLAGWSARQTAARQRALAHLANYWDRADSGVFGFRRYELGTAVDLGNPAKTTHAHLVHFEVDERDDWRARDDVRDLPPTVRDEVEVWVLEQVLRYARAIESRADGSDEWRRGLHVIDREARIVSLRPLQTESERLRRRLAPTAASNRDATSKRPVEAPRQWMETYLEAIEIELDGQRPRDELSHYETVLRARPNCFWGHYRAAAVAYRLAEYQSAAQHLDACIALRPANAMLRAQLAGCLYRTGRTSEALAACNSSIAIDPTQPETYYARSHIRKRLGQNAESAADLKQFETLALRRDKDLAGRLRLDVMLARGPEDGPADENELRRILELDPQHVDARVLLADHLMRDEKHAEAEQELHRVLVLNPDHLWARYTHGVLLERLRRGHPARDEFALLINHPGFADFIRRYPIAINAFHLLVHHQLLDREPSAALETAKRGMAWSETLRSMRGESHYTLARAYAAAAKNDPSLGEKVIEHLCAANCVSPEYVARYLPRHPELTPFRDQFLKQPAATASHSQKH